MIEMMKDVETVRKDFPFLNRQVNGKPIIYLDNAATTQKPKQVISALFDFYQNHCANIQRAVHLLSQEASELYEAAREKVARFLNCSENEILFIRNATEGINLVSRTLKRQGNVLVPLSEHHSNILPWRQGRSVHYATVDDQGNIDIDLFSRKFSRNTALAAFSTVNNSLGVVNPVKEMIELAKANGALTLVDASQSVAHTPTCVADLDCDFLVFSGHKMYAPSGIGVLYVRHELLKEMPALYLGGGTVKDVTIESHSLNDLPMRFEAGTPNIEGAIALGAAVDYLEEIGWDWIIEHESDLHMRVRAELNQTPGVSIHGENARSSVIAFTLDNYDSHVVARILSNKANVMARSGYHCAHPLHAEMRIRPTVRVSFGMYNSQDEIDVLLETLEKLMIHF